MLSESDCNFHHFKHMCQYACVYLVSQKPPRKRIFADIYNNHRFRTQHTQCSGHNDKDKRSGLYTFITQLYIKQCIYTVDSSCAYSEERVRTSWRQSTQQSSKVVEGHHVLSKDLQKLKGRTK